MNFDSDCTGTHRHAPDPPRAGELEEAPVDCRGGEFVSAAASWAVYGFVKRASKRLAAQLGTSPPRTAHRPGRDSGGRQPRA
jgi:hypothetical protein